MLDPAARLSHQLLGPLVALLMTLLLTLLLTLLMTLLMAPSLISCVEFHVLKTSSTSNLDELGIC